MDEELNASIIESNYQILYTSLKNNSLSEEGKELLLQTMSQRQEILEENIEQNIVMPITWQSYLPLSVEKDFVIKSSINYILALEELLEDFDKSLSITEENPIKRNFLLWNIHYNCIVDYSNDIANFYNCSNRQDLFEESKAVIEDYQRTKNLVKEYQRKRHKAN